MKLLIPFPDNRKCPRCGSQTPLFVLLRKGVWRSRWSCWACGAPLALRPRRLVVAGLAVASACLAAATGLWGESASTQVFLFLLLLFFLNLFSSVVPAAPETPSEHPRHDGEPASRRRKWIREKVFSGVLIVIGVYVGLTLLLYALQSKMLYYPTRTMEETPGDVGLSYEDVTFEAADGVKLHGWFVPAGNARAVILFCHGNAGNISGRLDTLRVFHALRLSTFIFDYRGYGKSEGKPTEEGTYLDAEAAWRHLTEVRGAAADEVFVAGRSLGGAVAAHLAAEVHPRGVILESAFTSVPDMAAELYPILPVRPICRYRYSTMEAVGKMRCPILIIHSPEDTLVPFRHGRRLYETASPADKTFLEITGDHNWGFMNSGKLYVDGLDRFISRELETARRTGE